MRHAWIVAGWIVLACASGTPAPKVENHEARSSAASAAAFPPTGPIELRPGKGPPEGTLYQLLMSYEGRTEVIDDRPGASEDAAQSVHEQVSLEIDYRQTPVATGSGSELANSLTLEALKRRMRAMPPGAEHVLEIGDDRLRTQMNDKVETDLRGAQPKQDLTPRTLLGKSFALVVTDASGNPKGITVRGLPPAKRMLANLPLRESLGYLQVAYPDRPVAPGDTWRATRYFPNPIGKLGLSVDVEMRLIGFERIDEVPCAHIVMRAQLDATKVPSAVGFVFDEVRYSLAGDAWFDLDNGQVVVARIEDVAATLYRKTATATPARVRMRYEGRSALKRLDALPPSTTWADGTKRFSAVK